MCGSRKYPYPHFVLKRHGSLFKSEAYFWLDYVNKGCSLCGVYNFLSKWWQRTCTAKSTCKPGKLFSDQFRVKILNMIKCGFSKKQIHCISWFTGGTTYCQEIICHFLRYWTLSAFSLGGREPRKVTNDVLQRIEIWKLQNEYGYRVQYSNNQSIIAFLKLQVGSMFK